MLTRGRDLGIWLFGPGPLAAALRVMAVTGCDRTLPSGPHFPPSFMGYTLGSSSPLLSALFCFRAYSRIFSSAVPRSAP